MYFEGRVNVNVEKALVHDNNKWKFGAGPLEVPYGVTTNLQLDFDAMFPEFYLDWHDMLNMPGEARMHLYPGESGDASYKMKLGRMTNWVSAIKTYDSMMTDVSLATVGEIEELLTNIHLPRLQRVVLETGTVGLRRLFSALDFPIGDNPPYPYIPEWSALVEAANSEKLIKAWKAQKGR